MYECVCVSECGCVLVTQSCLTLCDPMDCSLLYPGNSPSKNIGVSCHSLLKGIFPTQGSNLGLLHCRQILYRLSHQGRPTSLNFFSMQYQFGHFYFKLPTSLKKFFSSMLKNLLQCLKIHLEENTIF